MLIFRVIQSIRTLHETRTNSFLLVVRQSRKEKIIKQKIFGLILNSGL